MPDPSELDHRSRPELIEDARRLGIERPERMTRAELKDEILRKTRTGSDQTEARGLFGVARSMLASVVETGLHLPDAAALIRGTATFDSRVARPAPVATVTLAEIYAVQGHKKRALGMLDEVLAQEPDHEVALRLRRELGEEAPGKEGHPSPLEQVPSEVSLVETSGVDITTADPPPVVELSQSEPTGLEPSSSERPTGVLSQFELPRSEDEFAETGAGSPFPVKSQPDDSPDLQLKESEQDVSAEVRQVTPDSSAFRTPLLVFLRGANGPCLYWQLDVRALVSRGFDVSAGQLALQATAFWPGRPLPVRQDRSVLLGQPEGEVDGLIELPGWDAALTVRAALGWQSPQEFSPIAVSIDAEDLRKLGLAPEIREKLVQQLG